jgi:hypothetical protein
MKDEMKMKSRYFQDEIKMMTLTAAFSMTNQSDIWNFLRPVKS